MKKFKFLAVNLTIIFASLFLGVAIAEVGVRIAGLKGLKKILESTHGEFYPSWFSSTITMQDYRKIFKFGFVSQPNLDY